MPGHRTRERYARTGLEMRLIGIAEGMLGRRHPMVVALKLAGQDRRKNFGKFRDCVNHRVGIVLANRADNMNPEKASWNLVREMTRRFFWKITEKDEELPFMRNGEQVALELRKAEEPGLFGSSVLLVLSSIYDTNDEVATLEILKTFREMAPRVPEMADRFAKKAVLCARDYPEHAAAFPAVFRGHRYISALKVFEGNDPLKQHFQMELEKACWRIGSESMDGKLVGDIAALVSRLYGDKRERVAAEFLGRVAEIWEDGMGQNATALRNICACAKWLDGEKGDVEMAAYLSNACKLARKIEFTDETAGIFFLLAKVIYEGEPADGFVNGAITKEEGYLLDWCEVEGKDIREWEEKVKGSTIEIDIDYPDSYLETPAPEEEGTAPRVRAGSRYSAIMRRPKPGRARKHTPKFGGMSHKEKLEVDFYMLGAVFGEAYKEKAGKVREEDVTVFCKQHDRLLEKIKEVRDSMESDKMKKDYVEVAGALFKGLNTDISNAGLAFEVLGELMAWDGVIVSQAFVGMVIEKCTDSEKLRGICEDCRSWTRPPKPL